MSDIKPGAKVRATLEGEWTADGYIAVESAGVTHNLLPPPLSDIEVVSDPLPPEPPVGAYVEVLADPVASPDLWRRSREIVEPGVLREGWICLTYTEPGLASWADLHEDGAKVTRLYREGDRAVSGAD